VTIFKPLMQYAFKIDVTSFSSLACKSYWYVNYAFATIPPMLNVYISIERFISIAYPSKKEILRKKHIQWVYTIVLTFFNLGLYVPVGIYFDLTNGDNNQTYCDFSDVNWLSNIGYIDLTNRVIVPSLLMIIFSIMIITTIFKSRSRMAVSSSSSRQNRTFQKDVRFSLLSVMVNISYIVFSLPVSILVLFPNFWLSQLYILFTFVYYMAYSANFYWLFSANSLFRGGFYSIFVCSKTQPQQQRPNRAIAGEITRNRGITGPNQEISLQYLGKNKFFDRV